MKTSPFNPFDYLETKEEMQEYLSNAYQDEDPRIFIVALGNLAKHIGVANVAQKSGLSRENLYKVFSGKVDPHWSTIRQLMLALNFDYPTLKEQV